MPAEATQTGVIDPLIGILCYLLVRGVSNMVVGDQQQQTRWQSLAGALKASYDFIKTPVAGCVFRPVETDKLCL
jgi:hypothetical protein